MKFSLLNCIAIFIAIASLSGNCWAQDLRITSISDGAFPDIEVRARVQESPNDSITITERGNYVKCQVQESEATIRSSEGRMYVFLVENSYSFYRNGVDSALQQTLLNLSSNLNKYDNANILLFGMPNGGIRYVSAEQSNDFPLLKSILSHTFAPQTDSTYLDNDLILSIEEALEYCRKHQNPQQTVILTVIARPLNLSNTREFSQNFKEKIVKSRIYINLMLYDTESQNMKYELENLSQITGGLVSTFKAETLEHQLAQQIERTSKTKARYLLKDLVISFVATQEGTRNSFNIKYGNTSARCEYTNPNKSGFLGKYPIAISMLIGLAILVAALAFFIRTKRKIIRKIDSNTQTHFHKLKEENSRLRQEIDKYKRHPLSLVHNFDNVYIEETLIGSGKIVPKIIVDDRKNQKVFKITKFTMTLGRADSNDIVIDNRTVSSHHATITNEGGLFYITDNDSTNGIFVNDIRITKSKIQPKDRIRIGAVMATLVY